MDRFNIKLTFKVTLAVLLCFFLKASSFAANSEIIYDDCYTIKTFGAKTGYLCVTQREKSDKNKKYISTERHYYQKIKRLNNFIEIKQDTNFLEDKSGNPVSFYTELNSSGEKTLIAGKFISPAEIAVDFDINGVKSTKTVKLKDNVLFPYAIDNLYKYPDNKSINYSTIEPGLDIRVIKIKSQNIGEENLKADGLNHNYYKYKVSTNILPGIALYEWRDKKGKDVKESVPILKMEQILADKNDTLNISGEIKEDNAYDLFTDSLILSDKTISDPELIKQVVYKIKNLDDIEPADSFIADERQKISKLNNNTYYLTSITEKIPEQSYAYPFDTNNMEEYLQSGPFIITDSNKISSTANALTEGETDAYKIAKKMEAWVFSNITNKDFSMDFANAITVLESKTGDCTEHSVLLAALLRSAKIPSKIVVGLVYTDNPKPSFGYHMWVKAYVGKNKWVNLDAALPYKIFVPTHLAMAESPLNNISDRADLLVDVMKSFSSLKINVLEIDKVDETQASSSVIKINFSYPNNDSILNIKTTHSGNADIDNISLADENEQDYSRSALYNFTKGDIKKAQTDFNINLNLISDGDDFSYITLGIKLANLGFFNLASKSFDNVKDKDIWGLTIENTKKYYFPLSKYSPSNESIICDAISKIKYQNLPDETINLLNQNKKIFINDDYYHYLLSKAFVAKNKSELAQNEIISALKLNPQNIIYRMELAKIYIQQNSFKSAERELNNIDISAKKQKLYDRAFWQDFNEQKYWMLYKSQRNHQIKSRFYKAKYYEAKEEFNTALDMLNQLIVENSYKSNISEEEKNIITEALDTAANICLENNKTDKAVEYFSKILISDEKNAGALAGMADAYFLKKNFKSALEYYKKSLDIKSDNNNVLLNLANIYKIIGKDELSETYYLQVLNNDKNNSEANYYVGVNCLIKGDLEEGEIFIKKALSVDSLNSALWIKLAEIEIAKKDLNKAKSSLVAIKYTDKSNPYLYYYNGLINKQEGNLSAARDNLYRAVELKPDFTEANQALESF